MPNIIWKSKGDTKKQPWGIQKTWAAPWGQFGKIIYLDAGKRTSKKMYKRKNEILYLLSGKVIVEAFGHAEFYDYVKELDVKCFVLEPGDTILIEPESTYRLVAEEDSVIIDIIAVGCGFDDPIRFEDDFGRIE